LLNPSFICKKKNGEDLTADLKQQVLKMFEGDGLLSCFGCPCYPTLLSPQTGVLILFSNLVEIHYSLFPEAPTIH
jgi:hypothetical protein